MSKPGFTLGVGPLLLCGFAVPVSNSMVFPALSDLQDRYGFSNGGLGIISASGFFASFLVQLLLAPLADKGRQRTFVLAALLLASAGSVMFAFGTTLWMFIAARAVAGVSLGLSGPAVRAIVGGLDRNRAAERLGRLRGIELAGFTGGPLIGALLIEPLGLRGAFLVFGGVALVGFVLVWGRPLPQLPPSDRARSVSIDLLRDRKVRAAVLASVTLFVPVGIYDSLWDRYITDRGGNNLQVGLTFLLYTIPFVLFAARGGRLADRIGPSRATVRGIWLIAPLVFIYGVLPTPELLIAFGLVEGLFGAVAAPAAQAFVARSAPEGRATATQGLAGSGDLLMGSAMSLVAPIIYGRWGPEWTFGFAAVLMVFMGAVVAVMARGADEPRPAPNV